MLLTQDDIDHLLYVVGKSKEKCLDGGTGIPLKPEAMRYSHCSKIYTKLVAIKDAYDTYEVISRGGE